jgi:cytochrome P450
VTATAALDLNPFADAFLEDPYPCHELLRDAGAVVWLPSIGAYGMARYAEVKAVLTDHVTFCSSRGVGLSDFAKETPVRPASLLLETDPPIHCSHFTGRGPRLACGVSSSLQSASPSA